MDVIRALAAIQLKVNKGEADYCKLTVQHSVTKLHIIIYCQSESILYKVNDCLNFLGKHHFKPYPYIFAQEVVGIEAIY